MSYTQDRTVSKISKCITNILLFNEFSYFALKNTSRSCIRSLFRSFVLHTTVRDHVSPTTAVRRLPLLRAADTTAALPLLLRAP